MTVHGMNRRLTRHQTLTANFRLKPLASDIAGSFTWILLAVLAASVAVALQFLSTARPVEPAPPAARPVEPVPPPQVETRIRTEGLDANRRPLPFTVYILSQEFSWKLESVSDLEGSQNLVNPELAAAVNRARDVICVGTASFEGATRVEEARAAERAGTLARWLGSAVRDPRSTRVFSVNAGQYKGPPALESANQRKAIVIVTEGHADDVDLSQALESGLRKKQQEYPIVYSLLHHYSRSGEWIGQAFGGEHSAAGAKVRPARRRRGKLNAEREVLKAPVKTTPAER